VSRAVLPLLLALALAAAGPAAASPVAGGAPSPGTVPGEVVVAAKARAAGAGAAPFRTIRTRDVAGTLRRLRASGRFRYAVRNVRARAAGFDPGDPGRGKGWAAVQWNFAGPFGIGMPDAWANAIAAGRPGGLGVTVAVLDTGVAYARRGPYRRSPDLNPARIVRGYDFVDDDPYPYDANGHGTHVASTIAESTGNGKGLTGIAYRANVLPVRVLDDAGEGDATAIARGVRFATRRGADIINLSLEFTTDVGAREIPQLLDAIAEARRRGILVVGASGNEAEKVVAYPARSTRVFAVGATTERGCLGEYSNQGQGLDLVAPGGGPDAFLDDAPCRPDLRPGANIRQVTIVDRVTKRFGIAETYQGTSMAVPHVSGVAALVLASGILGPDPTVEALERRLVQTARDLGPPGPDTRYGAGLLDAAAATNPAIPVPTPASAPPATPAR
jgi:serine protease